MNWSPWKRSRPDWRFYEVGSPVRRDLRSSHESRERRQWWRRLLSVTQDDRDVVDQPFGPPANDAGTDLPSD